LRGVDDGLRQELAALALRGVEYLFFGPAWQRLAADWQPDPSNPTIFFNGPRQAIAVAFNDDYKSPPFSDSARWGANYLPEDGLASGVETYHVWGTLSYAHDFSQAGAASLENRYLKRALECWTGHDGYASLLADFARQAGEPSNDNSANWIGFVGRLQNLGVR
jgi:hypothetical protein